MAPTRGAFGLGPARPGALALSLDHEWIRLDRALSGSEDYPALGSPGVDLHSLRLGLSWAAPTDTVLGLSLPLTWLRPLSEDGEDRVGPGDLELTVAQPLDRWLSPGPLDLRLTVLAGLSLPTGDAEEAPVLTATDLEGGVQAIRLVTSQSRAALGSGAFWATGGLGLGLRPWGPVALQLTALGRAPLDDAPDGTRWGAQLDLSARVAWAPPEAGWQVWLGAAHRRQAADDRPLGAVDAEAETLGATGGRTSGHGSLGGQVPLGPSLTLRAEVEVPFGLSVAGVQLAERVATRLGVVGHWTP